MMSFLNDAEQMSDSSANSLADGYSLEPAELATIEGSLRLTVFHGIAASAGWLLLGTVLQLVAALQLVSPGWFADCAYFNHGKVSVAADTALVYGFALQILSIIGIYISCRLSRKSLRHPFTFFVASKIWNLGVLLGIVGIFIGDASGHEFFALPGYAAGILLIAALVMAVKNLLVIHFRTEREFYPAQIFQTAGIFWFVWVLATALIVLQFKPVSGVAQFVVAKWYANGLFQVVMGCGGLAALLYFVPLVAARPLYSRELAFTAFWLLLFVGGWTGLSGRWPLPMWISGVSSMAAFMLVVPLVALALLFWRTVAPELSRVVASTAGKFLLMGTCSYLLWLFAHVAYGCNVVNGLVGDTHFESAREALFIYGFIGMTSMGAVSMILPRLISVDCDCGGAKIVFQLALVALVLLVVGNALAGLQQGAAWANGSIDFAAVSKTGSGMLQIALLGGVVMTAAVAMFLFGTASLMVKSLYCDFPVLEWMETAETQAPEKESA